MSLSEIVNVQIVQESASVAAAGFGVALILSSKLSDRVATYTDPDDMLDDGFATSDPEYRAAVALMSQNPKPTKFVVGKLTNKPTQKHTIKVATVRNSHTYRFSVIPVGVVPSMAAFVEVEFTSDANATNDEIVTGLKAAFDAAAPNGLTSSITGGVGSTVLVITANASGTWHTVGIAPSETVDLMVAQDHADPGVAADLAAIQNEDDSWYAVINPWNSKAMIEAIATWCEPKRKLFVAATIDSEVIATAIGSAADVAKALNTSARGYAAAFYHALAYEFADAAWLGRCLPLDPGSETWKFKTLAGVTVLALTATQITNAKAKKANVYRTIGGVAVTTEGYVAAGEWIDTVRGIDWLRARMAERVFGRIVSLPKLPFTDGGIAVIEGEVRAQLTEGVAVGLLAADPKPTVTVPKVASVSSADKQARTLKGVKFSAKLAGAVHDLTINGTITV